MMCAKSKDWRLAWRTAENSRSYAFALPVAHQIPHIGAHTALPVISAQDDLPKPEIPEACEQAHNFAGLSTVVGFLVAFVLTKVTEE
jgi:hypothetical protein